MNTLAVRFKLFTMNWLYWLMVLLALAGLGISAYLMWGYTTPGAILACGQSSGCETVKNSVYASLMGIPLPVIGLVSYLTILILLIFYGQFFARGVIKGSAYTALAIFGISLTGVLYSAYLTYLELFVIKAICRWCVASAVIMAVIFFLSILNLRYEGE
jgi:uncharacterized membrane protein